MSKGVGSISLLIDSPLADIAKALRAIGPEVRKQINTHTKADAQPIWFEEVREGAHTRLQQRVLVNSARVGVTSRNVLLRSGGRAVHGADLTRAVEFGGGANKRIRTHSRKGTAYTRRLGPVFGPRYRNGAVVYPAAARSIPRFASLWVQTVRRTMHEMFEEGDSR